MDRILWTAEEIRKEIRKLDKITGLAGAELPIHFHKRGRAVGRFSYSSEGSLSFSFNTQYFDDPTMPPEVLLDVVRHEYAHYMDYIDRGKSGHGKSWKMCCLVVGALPLRYFSMERVWRISELRQQRQKRNEQFDAVSAGMYVSHPRFGSGRIVCIRGTELNRVAEVTFANGDRKSLGLGWVCDHCPPEVVPERECA